MNARRFSVSLALVFALFFVFGATNAFADHEGFIKFEINHEKPKPTDPVKGEFKKFTIKKAVVDLKDLSKSMAVIEVDLASVSTGIPKRDEHIGSPDFFNVAKFATATITVNNIKGSGDDLTGDVTLEMLGQKKEWKAAAFKVTKKNDDGSIMVEGAIGMKRSDIGAGAAAGTGASDDVKVMISFHLKNT